MLPSISERRDPSDASETPFAVTTAPSPLRATSAPVGLPSAIARRAACVTWLKNAPC